MGVSRFSGKVVFVTGATSGIGKEIARQFIEEGANVIRGDRSEENLAAVKAEFGELFTPTIVSVTLETQVEEAVGLAISKFGRLDIAVNNASVSRGAPSIDLEESVWDLTVDTVLKGVFLSTEQEARAMKANDTGCAIVNIASLIAHVPMHTGSGYSSAKAGVEMFTKKPALELAQYGIRVNAILPGLIDPRYLVPDH